MKLRIDSSLLRAALAALWVYGGRGIGLLWIAALNYRLGVSQYGLYAMAVAIAPLIATPLESPFIVRSIRVDDDTFRAERFTRVITGTAIAVVGYLLVSVSFIAGYALIVAGGEITFNALKAYRLRKGHPHLVNRMDTVRQVSSVVTGGAVLFLVQDPSITLVAASYSIPWAIVIAVSWFTLPAARPRFPGGLKESSLLAGEALVNAANMQGDLLLLGMLTNSTVAGYYSLASVTAWALVVPAQAYGQTFHERLRFADGVRGSWPPMRRVAAISLASAALLAAVGAAVVLSPLPSPTGWAMLALSPFVFGRSMTSVLAIIMYAQRRDVERFTWALPILPLKLGLVGVAVALGWNATGAGIACSVAELTLLAAYLRLMRRSATIVADPRGGVESSPADRKVGTAE
ncbi:hypothetical protein MUG78_01010 [Gordonia alkaliphila]|uniref:lipopolysaccharide biosynthesis protein n=1 Tax=Gordonia alkaliphila TaxID=1053547 RepID=UPI001FF344D4|nr:hypothetical protein [Gordonia alkaliphila]MCK0438074.1 hypothetical protein [Gordonia alkaliphila]